MVSAGSRDTRLRIDMNSFLGTPLWKHDFGFSEIWPFHMIRDGENVNMRYILSSSTARIQTYVFHKILSGYCGSTRFQVIQQHFTSYFDSLEHFMMIKAIFVTLKCSFLPKIFSQKSIFWCTLKNGKIELLEVKYQKIFALPLLRQLWRKFWDQKKFQNFFRVDSHFYGHRGIF